MRIYCGVVARNMVIVEILPTSKVHLFRKPSRDRSHPIVMPSEHQPPQDILGFSGSPQQASVTSLSDHGPLATTTQPVAKNESALP